MVDVYIKWEGAMRTAVIVLFSLDALMFVMSGTRNIRIPSDELDLATKQLLGLPVGLPLYRAIGALELLAAAGLLAGLVFVPLGIAAAAGLVLLMLAAIVYHVRAGDPPAKLVYPGVPLVLSTAAFTAGLAAL
jgi:hypothetical protein